MGRDGLRLAEGKGLVNRNHHLQSTYSKLDAKDQFGRPEERLIR
jgi:hypothetical protein